MTINLTQEFIEHAWRRQNALFKWVLVPLSYLFACLSALRRWAYRMGLLPSHALPVPVVVVGNINMGGSGKTPVVIWLVEALKQSGYHPAVISRGYGGSARQPTSVDAQSSASVVGDEPVLIATRCACPVWVGANRVKTGKALLKAHPSCNVIVSDDGLQHYALQRDVEIAVVDTNTHQHARLLPAGQLREPLKRLTTVDAVVCNGEVDADIQAMPHAYPMRLLGTQFYNLADPNIHATAADFKRKTVMALAGIGNPERFFMHLQQLGLAFASVRFEDHHAFIAEDLAKIDSDVLIMTEKDAVKCKKFAQKNCWVLPVEANIDKALADLIRNKLAK